jgi:ankyrin repeat protein
MDVDELSIQNLTLDDNLQEEWRIEDQPNLKPVKKTISQYNSNLKIYCETGRIQNVKNCIEKGANIHFDRDSCLTLSCMNGHYNIVSFLIEENIRVKGNLFDYKPALIWSARNGHISILKLLINNYESGYINNNVSRYNITKTRISSRNEIFKIFHHMSLRDYSSQNKKDVILFLRENNVKIVSDYIFMKKYIQKSSKLLENEFDNINISELEEDDLFGDSSSDISVDSEKSYPCTWMSKELKKRLMSNCK